MDGKIITGKEVRIC